MLVFTVKEVFFYCSNGIMSESVSIGGDRLESLPLADISSFKLCGLLHKSRTEQTSTTISASVEHYYSVYLTLLNFYVRRVLTYDNDVLDAFSGVINAQLGMLGQFYWGLPQGLFARALLQPSKPQYTMSRRPGFPSWSWLGWKLDENEQHNIFWRDFLVPLFPLVHIYKHEEQSSPELLIGPRDDRGIEGYCVNSIDNYNASTKLEPLPKWPCIGNVPKLPQLLGQESFSVLIFWTHVARFAASDLDKSLAFVYMDEDGDWIAHFGSAQIEVILIATTEPNSEYTEFHGIAIERHLGYARRIGIILDIRASTWLAGNPKKELILLI
jgi:hypothetical protein